MSKSNDKYTPMKLIKMNTLNVSPKEKNIIYKNIKFQPLINM